MNRSCAYAAAASLMAVAACAGPLEGIRPEPRIEPRPAEVNVAAPAVRYDSAIRERIENQLLFDDLMSFAGVDVKVDGGVAVLDGSVDGPLARERAERIAAAVRGVARIDNRIRIAPAENIPAEDILRYVGENLASNPAIERHQLQVSVEGSGAVTLRGTVDSHTERVLAVREARATRGVRSVEDRVEVMPAPARAAEQVAAEIRQRLKWNAEVDDAALRVSVEDGVVRLAGTTMTLAQKQQAGELAWVGGVRDVDSSAVDVVSITAPPQASPASPPPSGDAVLTQAIQSALDYPAGLRDLSAEVDIARGTARLGGTADSLALKHAAERAARGTVGIVEVDNRIVVRDAPEVPAVVTEQRANAALRRDALTGDAAISVEVRGTTARLWGKVRRAGLKARAENIVAGVPGIRELANDITVDPPQS